MGYPLFHQDIINLATIDLKTRLLHNLDLDNALASETGSTNNTEEFTAYGTMDYLRTISRILVVFVGFRLTCGIL